MRAKGRGERWDGLEKKTKITNSCNVHRWQRGRCSHLYPLVFCSTWSVPPLKGGPPTGWGSSSHSNVIKSKSKLNAVKNTILEKVAPIIRLFNQGQSAPWNEVKFFIFNTFIQLVKRYSGNVQVLRNAIFEDF